MTGLAGEDVDRELEAEPTEAAPSKTEREEAAEREAEEAKGADGWRRKRPLFSRHRPQAELALRLMLVQKYYVRPFLVLERVLVPFVMRRSRDR